MCINFESVSRQQLMEKFGVYIPDDSDWPVETWQDHLAPVIVDRGEGPKALLASYGMIPRKRLPEDVSISTMNARLKTLEKTVLL